MPKFNRNELSVQMVRRAGPGSYVDGNGLMLRVRHSGRALHFADVAEALGKVDAHPRIGRAGGTAPARSPSGARGAGSSAGRRWRML